MTYEERMKRHTDELLAEMTRCRKRLMAAKKNGFHGSKETGAARRATLDLSRALTEYRKNRYSSKDDEE